MKVRLLFWLRIIMVALLVGLGVPPIVQSQGSSNCFNITGIWPMDSDPNVFTSYTDGAKGVATITYNIPNAGFVTTGSVDYRVEGITAVDGEDFDSVSGTADFTVFYGSIGIYFHIQFPIYNNPARTTPRTFHVVLSNPTNGSVCDTSLIGSLGVSNSSPPVTPPSTSVPTSTPTPTPTPTPPIPVVLVHGYNDSATAESWNAYVQTLVPSISRTPMVVNNLDMGYGKGGDFYGKPIEDNAQALKAYIADAKQTTGAKYVDIVAHSMGGLVTRAYIDHYMDPSAPDIRKLIMLGTPNGGSNSAVIAEIVHRYSKTNCLLNNCFYVSNAIPQLTPSFLRAFNQGTTKRFGVPFYGLAGNYNFCIYRFPFNNPLENFPNDVAVSKSSVLAIPHTNPVTLYPTNGSCEGDHRHMRDLGTHSGGQGIFDQFVKPLLLPGSASILALSNDITTQSQESEMAYETLTAIQFTDVQTGTILPGGRLEFIRTPEAVTQTSFIVVGNPNQIKVTLRDPNGRVIALTTNDPLVQYSQLDESFVPITSYTIKNPIAGAWTTVVEANTQTPNTGLGIAVLSSLISNLRLTTPLPTPISPVINAPLKVLAQLRQNNTPILGANVSATLHLVNGVTNDIILRDNGQNGDDIANDGIYTFKFVPTQPGVYDAAIWASGMQGNAPFYRSTAWAVWVSDTKKVFLPSIIR